MFEVLDMGASGLQAQRTRMDTIANNILNANTTRNAKGEKVPYRRRFVLFAPGQGGEHSERAGVHVQQIEEDHTTEFRKQFQPGHPDADAQGYVQYPNVDIAMEYVNALEASRAYEANVTMMDVSKAMINASLRLLA
jgi:flagellar basal-body rod protein FlgC